MSRDRATCLIRRSTRGDSAASVELTDLVYQELHGIAASFMRRERRDHTLRTTDLVHEAYVQLIDEASVDQCGRTHFLSIASSTMRRVLVSHARSRNALKRGGGWQRQPLRDSVASADGLELDLLDLDAALTRLGQLDSRKARVVELRFFGGLTNEMAAQSLGVSGKTAEADWYAARAWLHREMNSGRIR